jgi:hypothetical protein
MAHRLEADRIEGDLLEQGAEDAVELARRSGPVDLRDRQDDALGVQGGELVGHSSKPAGVLGSVDVATLVHVEDPRPAHHEGRCDGAIALHLLDQLGGVEGRHLLLHRGQDVTLVMTMGVWEVTDPRRQT